MLVPMQQIINSRKNYRS